MERRPHASSRAAEAAYDLDIVTAALDGDRVARERLVDRLASLPALIRARRHRFGVRLDDAQLEDVTQDVLLSMWRKLRDFDARVPLRTWALGFATIELLKHAERTRRRRELPMGVSDIVDESESSTFATADRLAWLLDRLPAQDVEMLRLKHVEDRTFAEIAAQLSCPLPMIKTRYYRALQTLRRRLPDSKESPDEP